MHDIDLGAKIEEPERKSERYKLLKRRIHTRDHTTDYANERKWNASSYSLPRTRRKLLHLQYLTLDMLLGLKDDLQVTCDIRHHLLRPSLCLITDLLFPGNRGAGKQA